MTDDPKEDGDAVGYGRPPKEHQFKKGEPSPNRRGRPRKPERSYTERQIRHDFLEVMEEEIELKIGGRVRRVPAIVGVYRRLIMEALKGDRVAIMGVIRLRLDLIQGHKLSNFKEIERLEELERMFNGDELATGLPSNHVMINKRRARSRKL